MALKSEKSMCEREKTETGETGVQGKWRVFMCPARKKVDVDHSSHEIPIAVLVDDS